jgi:DNA-binding NarL/FixJ family response regulator
VRRTGRDPARRPRGPVSGAPAAPVRVVVAADNPVVRLGVRAVLTGHHRTEVVAEAADGSTAVTLARTLRPDVVLLDVRMPAVEGLPVVVGALALHSRVVILTAADDPEVVTGAIGSGALSYLIHGSYGVDDLVRAVLYAARGLSSASPAAAAEMVRAVRRSAPPPRPGPPPAGPRLSTREEEVMWLVSDGLANDEIAGRLGLTGKTVKNHMQSIYGKLGVHSRTGALSVWLDLADQTEVG